MLLRENAEIEEGSSKFPLYTDLHLSVVFLETIKIVRQKAGEYRLNSLNY